MKKITTFIIFCILVFSLTACSNSQQNRGAGNASGEEISQITTENIPPQTAEAERVQTEDSGDTSHADSSDREPVSSTSEETGNGNILIAYFSYGENAKLASDVDASASASIQIFNGEVTGNTGVMAHMIAEASGGELFSIRTAEPYPDSYEGTLDVGKDEKDRDVRPELSTHIENLGQYDTVFVGFPNWWYGMPMVMYSFFDTYDFSGKTVIPFCTSGGSAFSNAIDEIRDMEPDATVLDGLHIGGSSVSDAESRVNEWVTELGLSEE